MNLEHLENRMTPATTNFVGGVLDVSGQTGPLTVSTTLTSGSIKVTDNVTNITFSGVTAINILGTNNKDCITFNTGTPSYYNFPPIREFLGNVTINGRNGDDKIILTGIGGFGDEGYIVGNLQVNGGGGDDHVTLSNIFGVSSNANFTNTNLDMKANTQFSTGGDFTFTAINSSRVRLDGYFFGIGGNLVVNGSAKDDKFISTTDIIMIVRGDVTMDFGPGDDKCLINVHELLPDHSRFEKQTSILMGSGNDKVYFGSLQISNVFVDLGNGNNCFSDLSNYPQNNYTVYENLTVLGGNHNDTITINGIGESITIDSQNGEDKTVLRGVGSTFNYKAGNGKDSLLFDSELSILQHLDINLEFGSGKQMLVLNTNFTLHGAIIGQSGGDYDFVPNGSDLSFIDFISYP